METVAHRESGLSKATWTDRDLDAMSWDQCQIHAIAVTDDEGPPDGLTTEEYLELDDVDDTAPSALELHFDLDYIVRRVQPPYPPHTVEFWVAPATLTFSCVWAISGDLRLRLTGRPGPVDAVTSLSASGEVRRTTPHPAWPAQPALLACPQPR